MRQTRRSETRRSRILIRTPLFIAAFAAWPAAVALGSNAPAPLSAAESRELASGVTTTRGGAAQDATREEMERLMEAHRKLSVERSRAAQARVNRSPAIPDLRKSESAAPFEAADEITVRQID